MSGEVRVSTLDPRHAPVGTGRGTLAGRPSLLVEWDGPGGTAMGEAAPLPGFGEDSFERAQGELASLSGSLLEEWSRQLAATFEQPDAWQTAANSFEGKFTSPAARFCVHMLVLRAAAGSCGVPAWRLLARDLVAPRLPQSAVVDPLSPVAREECERELGRGVRTLKVKVGRQSEAELEFVRALTGDERVLALRLDPNQAWSPHEAESFLQRCPREKVAWVEDPTAHLADWGHLFQSVGFPLAIDEPLCKPLPVDPISLPGLAALVLKPMALGGVGACIEWTRKARAAHKLVVLSHFFDGPVALGACVDLAFALNSPEVAPGLGDHAALRGYREWGQADCPSLTGAELVPAKNGPVTPPR